MSFLFLFLCLPALHVSQLTHAILVLIAWLYTKPSIAFWKTCCVWHAMAWHGFLWHGMERGGEDLRYTMSVPAKLQAVNYLQAIVL